MSVNDGGPAFPMSRLDYLAAKAMEGLIDGYDREMCINSTTKFLRLGFDSIHEKIGSTYAENLAEEAYIIARAMLAESRKGEK